MSAGQPEIPAPQDLADAVLGLADELDRIAGQGREAVSAFEDGHADSRAVGNALHEMAVAVETLYRMTENFR